MIEYMPLLMFLIVCLVLMLGYPVALSLAGTALVFAFVGSHFEIIDASMMRARTVRHRGCFRCWVPKSWSVQY